MSFRAAPNVIPSAARNLPPFACVRGREQAKRCERGMLHVIPAQTGIHRGRTGGDHAHHSLIMAIMVQNPSPPFACVRGREQAKRCERGMLHVIPAQAGNHRGRTGGKITPIIPPSLQSWFKPHLPPFASRKGARGMLVREGDGTIMPIIPPSWQSWFKPHLPPSLRVRGLGGCILQQHKNSPDENRGSLPIRRLTSLTNGSQSLAQRRSARRSSVSRAGGYGSSKPIEASYEFHLNDHPSLRGRFLNDCPFNARNAMTFAAESCIRTNAYPLLFSVR